MSRILTDLERERLWKQAWFELEGYLFRRMGNVKIQKARLARLYIHRPHPADVPKLVHRGAVIKTCATTLAYMDMVKDRMYRGRSMLPEQAREE